jgi:molybdopterin-binding protein
VVATISTRSADSLGLTVGKPAQVMIKASSVIVAVD